MNTCDEAAAAAGCIHSPTLHSSHRNKSPSFHFLLGGNTLGTGHPLTCTLARSDPASAHVVGVVGGKAPGNNPLMPGLREST